MAILACAPGVMQAQWGTAEKSSTVYSLENTEIASLKTARTSDGKTYVCWLQWDARDLWGYEVRLQLLDKDGNIMWDPKGIAVENKRNAGYTSIFSMVVTPQDDVIISWADAREEEDESIESPEGHISVLYKLNQKGEHLWGEDGVLMGDQYMYPALLYMFGDDLYASLAGSRTSAGSNQIVRIDPATGEFATAPIDFSGRQLVASSDGDFIAVKVGATGTEAMRFDRDLNKVWAEPATISSYIYQGYANLPYALKSDGDGGAVVSFVRNVGQFGHMPVVQHISGDGEAVFGESADVILTEMYEHDYTVIGVNPEEQTIACSWQISKGLEAEGGQLFDYFGERLWGDEGIIIDTKDSQSGYGFGPIEIYSIPGNNWLYCYADEIMWAQNQIYIHSISSTGETNWKMNVGDVCAATNCKSYLEGNDFYFFYIDEKTDENWNKTYSIETIRMDIGNQVGVEKIGMESETSGAAEYYSLDGIRLDSPRKGINIIKGEDGQVRKVLVK